MKLKLGSHTLCFSFRHLKTRKAYGIASGRQTHFLLMDFDTRDEMIRAQVLRNLTTRFKPPMSFYYTQHGFHAIIWKRFRFRDAAKELINTPYIDLNHVRMGLKRGYWFLEQPFGLRIIVPPKKLKFVRFMVIDRNEK